MDASHEVYFGHEKLDVYQEAIAFVAWLSASWKQEGVSATSRINWTARPLRSR